VGVEIRLTPYGSSRTRRFVQAVDYACRATAMEALRRYRLRVLARMPGQTTAGAIQRAPRDVFVGHPTEAERPHVYDVVARPDMGQAVILQNTQSWAYFGNRHILDADTAPMYWRGEWTGGERGQGELVRQDEPPIWAIIEYGAGEHPISPRGGRTLLRFRDQRSGEIVYRPRVERHPGAFRKEGVRLGHFGSLVSFRQLQGVAQELNAEPFGRAPFRVAHWQTVAEVQTMFRGALIAYTRGI